MERQVHRAAVLGFAAIGWLMLASCSDGLGPSADATTACTITISGATAIAGAYSCSQPPVTIWVTSSNVGAISLNISGSKSITGLFVFTGVPTAGTTYTSANSAGLQSYGILVTVGSASWQFAAGQSFAPLGSGSLTFTTVAPATSGSSGSTYTAHGTMDASLVPAPGTTASGDATMHIVF
jgi:hypothetical protein